jgi:hypothetical protein
LKRTIAGSRSHWSMIEPEFEADNCWELFGV